MSMHKIPLTPIEESGLRAHGLDIGKPSQLSDAFRQGVRYASTQLPSQGGEAVEVVAWRHWGDKTRLLCDLGKQRAIPGTIADEFTVPLMTVAQHQRILAAGVGIAEPVAMKTHGAWDGLDDLKDLPDGTKLYTHPADQVAEGVVVPIKLLKIIEQSWRIPNGCPKSVSEEVGEIIGNGLAELRALLNGGRS